MKLQAYVFCDCYEQDRVKRPPPNPELVKTLSNGDLTCYQRATPAQHAAFLAWRTHACCHPEGVVTGGDLGLRLPLQILRDALAPHRHSFPILLRKILECKPQTQTSRLTLKQVEKLQAELTCLKTFRVADRNIDRELRCLLGRLKHLVRAAFKFRKPIAI